MSVVTNPPPSEGQAVDRQALLVAVALLAVFNAGDLLLTRLALGRGPVEANPLARILLGGARVEVVKLGLVALLWARVERRRPALAFAAVLWCVTGAYAMVVLSNALVLFSSR